MTHPIIPRHDSFHIYLLRSVRENLFEVESVKVCEFVPWLLLFQCNELIDSDRFNDSPSSLFDAGHLKRKKPKPMLFVSWYNWPPNNNMRASHEIRRHVCVFIWNAFCFMSLLRYVLTKDFSILFGQHSYFDSALAFSSSFQYHNYIRNHIEWWFRCNNNIGFTVTARITIRSIGATLWLHR